MNDTSSMEIKDYYVAALDILGYKNAVAELFANPHTEDHLIQRIYSAMYQSGIEVEGQDSPDGIHSEVFSDTIVLSIPCEAQSALSKLINMTSSLCVWFFENKLLLRGGIARGKQVRLEDGKISILASEGLIKAHKIESELAIHPTIVFDNDEKIIGELKGSLSRYAFVSSGMIHLNYLRYALPSNDLTTVQSSNEKVAKDYLKEIVSSITQNHNNFRVREKYEWLLNYFLWFIEKVQKKTNGYANINLEIYRKFSSPKCAYDFHAFIDIVHSLKAIELITENSETSK